MESENNANTIKIFTIMNNKNCVMSEQKNIFIVILEHTLIIC